jgi:FkbM family methyltransferase
LASIESRSLETKLISGTKLLHIFRSFKSHLFYLTKFLLRRRGFGRFVLITPSIPKSQILFDRKLRRVVKIEIRDHIDLQTLKMIWLWGDYDLENLRRSQDIHELYTKIVSHNKIPLIIDLGGHAGISAAYFAYSYPAAKIVVLEPHPLNYSHALKNTKHIKNVSVQNMAIGDTCARGELEDPGLGNDAYRNIFNVDEGSVQVINMKEILARYSKISFVPFIIKCDIEGSEKQLFSSNTDWVEQFKVLIIELHDWLFPRQEISKNFLKTVSNLEGDFVHSGENIFFIQDSILDDLEE